MSDFIKEWNQESGVVRNAVSNAVINTSLYGWNLVTAKTPVRTGRARSSWNLSVDSVENQTKKPITPYPSKKGAPRSYQNPSTPRVEYNIDKDRSIFIANNVEYILALEEGSPTVTSFAMVSSSIPAINNKLKRELKSIK